MLHGGVRESVLLPIALLAATMIQAFAIRTVLSSMRPARRRRIPYSLSVPMRSNASFCLEKRSLSTNNITTNIVDPEVSSFLKDELHLEDERLQRGIVKALQSVYGSEVRLPHLHEFGRSGLMELAVSVQKQQQQRRRRKNNKRPFRMVHFAIPHHRTAFDLKWRLGESLLDVAKSHPDLLGEYMEGTCGGQMSCCTCHVYLDEATFAALGPPCEAEEDMLDLAYEPRAKQSRLACQVKLREAQLRDPDITITIPTGVNDVWK